MMGFFASWLLVLVVVLVWLLAAPGGSWWLWLLVVVSGVVDGSGAVLVAPGGSGGLFCKLLFLLYLQRPIFYCILAFNFWLFLSWFCILSGDV